MKKVLIVDDDEAVRGLIYATLEGDERFTVLTAGDGDQALSVALQERPDLVLLDILMPKADGYTVCQALKSNPHTAKAKVVMLTALAQETSRERARQLGADDYLTKPFSPTMLIDKVEHMLGV